MERGTSTMATKKELEELGKKFLDKEIEVLNDTSVSIFEDGIYNRNFLLNEEWERGINEFLMYDYQTADNKRTRLFYQGIAELINKAYLRIQECLNSVDRINLKVYIQLSEILEHDYKIFEAEKYQTTKGLIEIQEQVNETMLSIYSTHLKRIKLIKESEKLKELIKKTIEDDKYESLETLYLRRGIKSIARDIQSNRKGKCRQNRSGN